MTGANEDHQGAASAVDELVDLGRESASRASQGVVRRFEAQIRVVRQIPCVARECGRVLVGTVDCGVHADVPDHLAVGVGLGDQSGVDPVPGAIDTEPVVPLPDRLPWTEVSGEITPGDGGSGSGR